MEDKTPEPRSREALADYLSELSRQLRQGELAWGQTKLTLPETGEVEFEVKEKGGRLKVKVTLAFGLTSQAHSPEGEKRAADFKTIKKKLAAAFGQLKRLAAAGQLPPLELVQEFQTLSQQFAALAEPAWGPEVKNYLGHVVNLVKAVDLQEPQLWQHEMADLQLSLEQCHKELK